MSTKTALDAKTEKHMRETGGAITEEVLAGLHATTGTASRQTKNVVNNFDEASEAMDEATKRILAAGAKLADATKKTTLEAKTALGRAKDMQAQLVDSLNRCNKILGTDFEVRLQQLERMSAALSTLADLEKSGVLKNVISAISRPT